MYCAAKITIYKMKNTHFTRKTIVLIAFLYSFCLSAQQNDTEKLIWEGDTEYCTINGNSVQCNTEENTTIYTSRNDTAEITWKMNVSFPKESYSGQSYIYIYPVINGFTDFDQYQKIQISRVNQNCSVSFEGSSEISVKENVLEIYANLGKDQKWLIRINGEEFEELNRKSQYISTKGLAFRFINMKNARISGIEIESSNSTGNTPDEPEPENPDDNEGSEGLKYGDIVISEVMSNPKNCPGYPEIEYIEIYNRSESPINLEGWTLRYGNSSYTMPYSILAPDNYTVLSHKKHADEWKEAGITNRIDMERFPVLANTGKQLYISDASCNLIAYTFYNDTRYNSNIKSGGGFSLERIDNSNINDTRKNWSATESPLGGTPGKENSIKGICSETEPASYLYYEMLSQDSIRMFFNSPLDVESATSADNYITDNNMVNIKSITVDSIYLSSITLVTDIIPDDENSFNISPQNILQADMSEVVFPEKIRIEMPHTPEPGEIVFNEILFDSDEETCEFVEIYNTTDKCLELGGLFFSVIAENGEYGKTSFLCTANRVMEPKSHMAFTSDTIKLLKRWKCNIWNVALCSLPALRNDGGVIALLNGNAEEIDAAVFTPSIYPKTGRGSKGISSEKVNPAYASSNPANWLPATAQMQYGTPGKRNSQFKDNSLTVEKGKFTLQEDFITPNQDGQNDYATINYSFDDGGYIVNIKVFSSNGREVAYPVKRETLASYGSIIWDGKDSEGNYLKPGIYILLIEAHNEKGDSVKQKIAIAVN